MSLLLCVHAAADCAPCFSLSFDAGEVKSGYRAHACRPHDLDMGSRER